MTLPEKEKFTLGTLDVVAVAAYFTLILGVGLSVSYMLKGSTPLWN
jgi:hypothetical protein